MVKLVPVEKPGDERPLGAYTGKVKIRADLLEPLPDEIVEDFWPKGREDEIPS